MLLLMAAYMVISCKSTHTKNNDAEISFSQNMTEDRNISVDEIIHLTGTGILSSMTQALDLIRNKDLGNLDFGRLMNGVNIYLIRFIYPDSRVSFPPLDLPQTHAYTKIIRETEKGNYVKPNESSSDFFEYILPFLCLNNENSAERLLADIQTLEKAASLRPDSVLPAYFRGLIYERSQRYADAEKAYREAYAVSDECYPALAGVARVLSASSRKQEAAELFSNLVIRYPDSLTLKKQSAVILYESGDYSRAASAIDEILQAQPRDGELILMKTRILVESGSFTQAQAALDSYAAINTNNRLYLFLRARVQAEGYRNRDAALNYLRSIINTNPDDIEILIYAAGLLLESQRSSDQSEGREILNHLQQTSLSSEAVLNLSLRDAVQRENWREAQAFLNSILSVRRSNQDLIDGYYIEKGLGGNSRALAYARELFDRDSSNNDYAAIYISALIDNNRNSEASRLLESYFASAPSGPLRSRYFYLRSRLHNNEDDLLGDLRSSLFEDPRNLQALMAMFVFYHNRREERRAVYYLKQALAIAPENPQVKRYEKDYTVLLGRNP
jgi:thioredoxin-like negative regulator of GroEL